MSIVDNTQKDKVVIQQGTWVAISEIPDVETWKKCIDAFVKAGAEEYEGYTELCEKPYTRLYHEYRVLEWWGDKGTLHSNNSDDNAKRISVKVLLSTLDEPEMKTSPLFNRKYKVTPVTSELLQKAVFAEGGRWSNGGNSVKRIQEECIYVDNNGSMTCSSDSRWTYSYFNEHILQEATLEVVKTIKISDVVVTKTKEQLEYEAALKLAEEAEQAAKEARLAVEKLKPKK